MMLLKTDKPRITMQKFSALLLTLAMLLVTACTPMAVDRTARTFDSQTLISEAEKSGDLTTAATAYLALADTTSGALRDAYLFRAGYVLHQQARYSEAEKTLQQIDTRHLTASERVETLLLLADIALLHNAPAQALEYLDTLNQLSLSSAQKTRALQARINVYQTTEQWLEKALAHTDLDPLLSGDAQQSNRAALWESLMLLTPQQLDFYNPGQPPAQDSGWFALAYALKAYEGNPDAIDAAIENWRLSYPTHPADISLYRSLMTKKTVLPDEITQIAVLLPESGPAATAGSAIKQGIIAAHFTASSKIQLKFYDVQTQQQTSQSNVIARYQQAVEDGAQVVIGPLEKLAVEILTKETDLTIPVLALNRIGDNQIYDNLLQFGLAPEDDAVAAADYARSQGFQRALVITPRSPWGDRVSAAFREAWQTENGQVLQVAQYNERENDYRDMLMPLLGLTASSERQRSLRNTLNRDLEFEPRRRQDVDFIFLVATPIKARQMIPQLQFHRAGQIPVIATSHAYTGVENAKEDIDLNNLIIMDIPWMSAPHTANDPAYVGLKQFATDDTGRFMRLAAMGVDAYRLLPELNTMRQNSHHVLDGATGIISINHLGIIERQMPAATFRNGVIRALPSSTRQP